MAEGYSGLVGAYRFAFRRSPSVIFRAYVLASVLVGGYVSLLLTLGLITWLAQPAGPIGQRSLLGVIALLVLIPLTTPVLVVARRYRRDRPGADRAFGLLGFTFVAAVYVGLLISDPAPHQGPGLVGLVLGYLDSLPGSYGFAPPILVALAIGLLIRVTGTTDRS